MTDQERLDSLKGALGGDILEITNPARRRFFITVDRAKIAAVLTTLRDRLGITYVAAISGVDEGDAFEILYHLAEPALGNVNVRIKIPKGDPHVASVTPVLPGAIYYERELQDMFGLVVDGIPDPRPLITSDDWPAANYPLRKDWKFERPAEIIPGGKK
jgi:NADH:ubiquinone oxidoreductase subunit C